MFQDLIFSYLHYVLIILMTAALAAEIVLVRPGLDQTVLKRVGVIDAAYGATAVLLVVIGFCRVYFGLKGADFYWSNPAFHLKLTLFVLLAIASVPPTVRFIQWRRGFGTNAGAAISPSEIKTVRLWLHGEALLLILIPLSAGLMARDML